jgi:hypothetical protein
VSESKIRWERKEDDYYGYLLEDNSFVYTIRNVGIDMYRLFEPPASMWYINHKSAKDAQDFAERVEANK